ncbi:hypothetical protein LXL04_001115 [Taraxacum kok-saghyz]
MNRFWRRRIAVTMFILSPSTVGWPEMGTWSEDFKPRGKKRNFTHPAEEHPAEEFQAARRKAPRRRAVRRRAPRRGIEQSAEELGSPQKVPLRGGPENSFFNFNGYLAEQHVVRSTDRHSAEVPSTKSLVLFGKMLI